MTYHTQQWWESSKLGPSAFPLPGMCPPHYRTHLPYHQRRTAEAAPSLSYLQSNHSALLSSLLTLLQPVLVLVHSNNIEVVQEPFSLLVQISCDLLEVDYQAKFIKPKGPLFHEVYYIFPLVLLFILCVERPLHQMIDLLWI